MVNPWYPLQQSNRYRNVCSVALTTVIASKKIQQEIIFQKVPNCRSHSSCSDLVAIICFCQKGWTVTKDTIWKSLETRICYHHDILTFCSDCSLFLTQGKFGKTLSEKVSSFGTLIYITFQPQQLLYYSGFYLCLSDKKISKDFDWNSLKFCIYYFYSI